MNTRLPVNISTAIVASPSKADRPTRHWYPMLRTVSLMLFALIFSRTSLRRRAANSRYPMVITPPATVLSEVASAAPITPQPSGNMNSQSSTTLSNAVTRLHAIAILGAPSRRMTNRATAVHTMNTHDGTYHTM